MHFIHIILSFFFCGKLYKRIKPIIRDDGEHSRWAEMCIAIYIASINPSHRLSSCSGRIMNCCSELQFSSWGAFCISIGDDVLWSCILTLFIFQLFSLNGSRIRPNTDSKIPTETDACVCNVPQQRMSTIPWCSILENRGNYYILTN